MYTYVDNVGQFATTQGMYCLALPVVANPIHLKAMFGCMHSCTKDVGISCSLTVRSECFGESSCSLAVRCNAHLCMYSIFLPYFLELTFSHSDLGIFTSNHIQGLY